MTEFRRWRELMGYSQKEAASALWVSRSTVCNWDAGVDRKSKARSAPSFVYRYAMRALSLRRGPICESAAWPK